MKTQVLDLEMNPIKYSYTYYFKPDSSFTCFLPKGVRFSRSGVKKIENYISDKKSGKELLFYNCSEIETPYHNKKEFRIKYIGFWSNGTKNGKWKYYSPNGKLTRIEIYKNGTLMKEIKK